MRRTAWVAVVGTVLCLAVAGCSGSGGGNEPSTPDVSSGDSTGIPVEQEVMAPEQFVAIPVSGANEQAAQAAVPAALKAGLEMRKSSGQPEPDLTGAEPVFTAYLVSAVTGNTLVLMEVHADGIAYPLYNSLKPIDPGSVLKQDASLNAGAILSEPASDAEKAAVAAAKAVMAEAFPGKDTTVKILGYRFNYLKGTGSILQLEVNPDGGVMSIQ